MWLLAQDAISGPVSAELFNYFVYASGLIILALVSAVTILYRSADKDKAERLEDVKELLKEQKDVLTGALETTVKVGSAMEDHARQLEKVAEALKLNTLVLEQVRSYLEAE